MTVSEELPRTNNTTLAIPIANATAFGINFDNLGLAMLEFCVLEYIKIFLGLFENLFFFVLRSDFLYIV